MPIFVIGLFIPRLDPKALAARVEADRERLVSIGYPSLQQQGFLLDSSAEELAERAAEIAQEKTEALSEAALIELAVDLDDDVEDLLSSVWEPVELSSDGNAPLRDHVRLGMPIRYRIAFWVFDWNGATTLPVQLHALPLPSPAPVPERLWKLVPFDLVD